MAFDFKFESLLKYRKRLEEAAQREFIAARRELDESLAKIQQMYASIEASRNYIHSCQVQGVSGDISRILSSEQFILGQKIKIDLERGRARELMMRVEEKQELLLAAAREFKKIEKLKERQRADFKKQQRRLETKRVDDLVVIRSGRRKTA